MQIAVDDRVHLSEFRLDDGPALITLLNDRTIYERTLRIPYPYTEADADAGFDIVARTTARHGRPVHWVIRDRDERLIGGCGLDDELMATFRRAELGYWLAEAQRGRGVMTSVVRSVARHAFEEFDLIKLTAHVFASNTASARVLEKCGFTDEGYLRQHYVKDGRAIDAKAYGLLRGDWGR